MNNNLPSTSLILDSHALVTLNHSAIDSKKNYTSFPKSTLKSNLVKARFRRIFIDVIKLSRPSHSLSLFPKILLSSFKTPRKKNHYYENKMKF